MKRDMEKIAKSAKIPIAYEITCGEVERLWGMACTGKPFEAFAIAFQYGFALALRMMKRKGA